MSVPTISTPPASQVVQEGLAATFTVVAAGTAPLTYQWKRGGVAIVGATSATYTTAALTSADDGAVFTVVVSNGSGSVTSAAATLTVAFSRREAIILTLAALLASPPAGITKPAGLAVHRFAMLPIEEDRLPAAVVYWTDCTPANKGEFIHQPDNAHQLLEYHLAVRVELRTTGEPVDQQLDPLCQYVRRVIFTDPSLGGKCWGCREDSIKVDAIAKDKVFAGAAVDLTFTYFEEPFTYPGEPATGGLLARASYPTLPTHQTLEVTAP